MSHKCFFCNSYIYLIMMCIVLHVYIIWMGVDCDGVFLCWFLMSLFLFGGRAEGRGYFFNYLLVYVLFYFAFFSHFICFLVKDFWFFINEYVLSKLFFLVSFCFVLFKYTTTTKKALVFLHFLCKIMINCTSIVWYSTDAWPRSQAFHKIRKTLIYWLYYFSLSLSLCLWVYLYSFCSLIWC